MPPRGEAPVHAHAHHRGHDPEHDRHAMIVRDDAHPLDPVQKCREPHFGIARNAPRAQHAPFHADAALQPGLIVVRAHACLRARVALVDQFGVGKEGADRPQCVN
jgi:hypothetical protein